MQSRKEQSIGAGKAEEIVIKAIRRVLEPDYMANIPPEPQEEAVTKAFEKIVIQSQSPPRQSMPGQQGPAIPTPAIASSAAATAAMTAAATAGATNGQSSASGTRPAPLSQQQPPAATATMHQQPQPQRPAESVLMNMLMAGPGRSASPAVPPPQPQASSTSPPGQSAATKPSTPAAVPVSSATATVTQLSSDKAEVKDDVDLAKVNGVLKDLPQIQIARANGTSTPTRPFVEPLTPPVPGSPKVGVKRERAITEQSEDGDAQGTGKKVKVGEAGKA
jgi:hypothetical protein